MAQFGREWHTRVAQFERCALVVVLLLVLGFEADSRTKD
jgi:hypothetical protein